MAPYRAAGGRSEESPEITEAPYTIAHIPIWLQWRLAKIDLGGRAQKFRGCAPGPRAPRA